MEAASSIVQSETRTPKLWMLNKFFQMQQMMKKMGKMSKMMGKMGGAMPGMFGRR